MVFNRNRLYKNQEITGGFRIKITKQIKYRISFCTDETKFSDNNTFFIYLS